MAWVTGSIRERIEHLRPDDRKSSSNYPRKFVQRVTFQLAEGLMRSFTVARTYDWDSNEIVGHVSQNSYI